MIRTATIKDLKDIMKIIKETITEMNSYNNYQWDENYPQEKDFINDIEKNTLFVMEENKKLIGFVCINKIEPIEYKELNWSQNEDAMVIHRMAVAMNCRRKGIGTQLINFSKEFALKNNIKYLKTDTNSLNEKMKSLFTKCDFKFIGEVHFEGKNDPFYCYEKTF